MNIVHLKQGTPEWLAHRMQHLNASDAPAMMGCSKYKTRSELVREIATGLTADVSPELQSLFDAGHGAEALARPLAEEIIGDELYPIVATRGKLSASFDGLTLLNDKAWEHKSLNDALRAVLPKDGVGDELIGASLPLMYRVQMEQQAEISGCELVLFTASKWHGTTLVEARHSWYRPDLELRAQINAGWLQFEEDVAAYAPPAAGAPAPIAESVELLPAVVVSVAGEIEVTANFKPFEVKLRDFLDHKLIRQPKTDQDFVDLDAQIKAMKAGRDALKGAKGQMLGGVQPVDQAVKTIDLLDEMLQKACSAAERTLKDEKERRKTEIVVEAQTKLREHCAALSSRVGVVVTGVADFAAVIKGLKSLDSMEDKLSTELARAKIAASQAADLIDANRKAMEAADAAGLFPDFSTVCTKPADDFANLITSRRAAAQARLDAERERIRAEEAARLEREARELAATQARLEEEGRIRQQNAEREEREAQERVTAEARRQQEAEAMASQAAAPAAARVRITAFVEEGVQVTTQPAAAPAPEVRAFVAPAVAELPTLTLGQIGTRLGFNVTADFLAILGFEAHKEKASRLYRPSLFPAICKAISAHVMALAGEAKKAA